MGSKIILRDLCNVIALVIFHWYNYFDLIPINYRIIKIIQSFLLRVVIVNGILVRSYCERKLIVNINRWIEDEVKGWLVDRYFFVLSLIGKLMIKTKLEMLFWILKLFLGWFDLLLHISCWYSQRYSLSWRYRWKLVIIGTSILLYFFLLFATEARIYLIHF